MKNPSPRPLPETERGSSLIPPPSLSGKGAGGLGLKAISYEN